VKVEKNQVEHRYSEYLKEVETLKKEYDVSREKSCDVSLN